MIYFIKKFLRFKSIPKRYDQLFDEVRNVKPANIMEIGVWKGERAKKMIELAKRYNTSDSIHYYGFDLFEIMDEEKYSKEMSKQPPSIKAIEDKLGDMGAHIHLFKGDTTQTLPNVVSDLPKMDLVFIDGGHSLETIENDWLYVSKLLKSGSMVIFDDYWPNRMDAGSKVAVDAIDRKEYSVTILPVLDEFDTTPFGPLKIQFAKVVKI